MARNSAAGSVGKGALGFGVGLALYFLIRRLGLGGRGEDAGEGRGPEAPAPAPAPRPPDAQPVHVLVQPSPADPRKAVIEMEGRIVSVGELASRVAAGGRSDVAVTVTGDTRHGAWREIREALEFLGIQIFLRQPSGTTLPEGGPRVSGNARGQYGASHPRRGRSIIGA